ncbi:MAG: hypothetical protein LBI66_06480 [Burkholderiaceae bacterium]|jgi:hypothetical protein|nr:hypothetical protein [Burkholderiaceae bacterium]
MAAFEERWSYEVGEAGWATLKFSAPGEALEYPVSYLHDSLGDLAAMALALANGAHHARAVFMDEPGEVHLCMQGEGETLSYELREYADWASWGITAMDDYEVLAHGQALRDEVVRSVYRMLDGIHCCMGVEEYRKRWMEHEFPLRDYQRLGRAIRHM